MPERENYEAVVKGFDILLPMLSAYVCGELSRVYKDGGGKKSERRLLMRTIIRIMFLYVGIMQRYRILWIWRIACA